MNNEVNEKEKELLKARPYQLEILEQAKERNVIVYLGTGSGKTFISIMLMKHYTDQLGTVNSAGLVEGGKKVIFLVNCIPLIYQQKKHIENSSGLKVESYCGEDGVDDWPEEKWKEEFSKNQVMLFMAEVFRSVVASKYMTFSQIALLVMDECHHAASCHPYKLIMDSYKEEKTKAPSTVQMPRILGLTASVVVKKVTKHSFIKHKLELERTMDAEVTTVVDLGKILQFVTNPEEKTRHVCLRDKSYQALENDLKKQIHAALGSMEAVYQSGKLTIQEEFPDDGPMATIVLKDYSKEYKANKKIFADMIAHIEEVGVYNLLDEIDHYIAVYHNLVEKNRICMAAKELENLHSQANRNLTAIKKKVTELNDDFRLQNRGEDNLELKKMKTFASAKFLALIDILKEEKYVEGNVEMMNITFVERKAAALAICKMLKFLAKTDPGLSHIRADYIHSPKLGALSKEANGTAISENKRLQLVLSKFRQGMLNTLISTDVIEEGLDVRTCNLIVRYNFPKNYRSYVQSKGRARAKPSKYMVLMEDREAIQQSLKLNEFREIEAIALEVCHNLSEPMDSDDDEDDLTIDYGDRYSTGEDGACIRGGQAIALVHKYISKLPRDRFTRLVPVWRISIEEESAFMKAFSLEPTSKYSYECYMPHKTPFIEPVVGPPRPNMKEAKGACALEIVKQLYEKYEELDYKLKVIKKTVNPESASDDPDDVDEITHSKVGSTKRRNINLQRLPKPLNEKPSSAGAYLYKIRLVLTNEINNPRYLPYHPHEDQHAIGLVLASQMSDIGPFYLHGPSGELTVLFHNLGPVNMTSELEEQSCSFIKYASSEILAIPSHHLKYEGTACLVVPLKNDVIDFSVFAPVSRPYDHKNDKDVVIYPHYKKEAVIDYYFIEELRSDITPSSVMARDVGTYKDYYQSKYNVDIKDPSQPMLRISSARRKKYLFKELSGLQFAKSLEDMSRKTLLVPELVNVARLPSGLWRQLQYLPFCLRRIVSMINSAHLLQVLSPTSNALEMKLPKGPNLNDMYCNPQLMQHFLHFDSRLSEGVNVSTLLEALTLRSAVEDFNMEKLEVLGDVFLKYRTSVFLYYSKAHGKHGEIQLTEGDLTSKRSAVVCNKNLYRLANKLGLADGSININKLQPHVNWLPPGFSAVYEESLKKLDHEFLMKAVGRKEKRSISSGGFLSYLKPEDYVRLENDFDGLLDDILQRYMKNEITNCPQELREHAVIPDKSMADVIEAIIGCFLLGEGQKSTLTMMARIGIDLTPQNTIDDLLSGKEFNRENVEEFIKADTAIVRNPNHPVTYRTDSADHLYSTLMVEKIEEIIGYTFKEKSFLLQAFTHSSFYDNRLTESYERLEFLGDSVLDYLVSCAIIQHYGSEQPDPGKLTETRSALVCNNAFASVFVSAGLHKFILNYVPELRSKILSFVELRDIQSRDLEMKKMKTSDANNNDKRPGHLKNDLSKLNETEALLLNEVEIPKVLGDVFEALIGAIFIDSGHDLDTVWKVYLLLNPDYKDIIRDPPANPKKALHELAKDRLIEYSKPVLTDDGVVVELSVGDEKFVGLGQNRGLASIAASKCALKKIYNKHY